MANKKIKFRGFESTKETEKILEEEKKKDFNKSISKIIREKILGAPETDAITEIGDK